MKIPHSPDCPVAQPGFVLPTLPNGQVDPSAPSQCRCDFRHRLSGYVNATTHRSVLISYLLAKVEQADWHGVSDAANDLRVLEAQNPELVEQ